MTGFDLGGSLGRGLALGQNMREQRQKNALSTLYQQHGAGIAAGDGNALNALAGLDPVKAFQLQRQMGADARADEKHKFAMDDGRERLGMARESHQSGLKLNNARIAEIKKKAAQAAREEAARLDAAAVEREKAETMGVISALRQAIVDDNPQAYEALKSQFGQQIAESGIDPDALTYDMAPYMLANLVGVMEGLEAATEFGDGLGPEQPTPLSSAGKFYADQAAGLIPADTPFKGSGVTVNNNMGGGAKPLGTKGQILVPDPDSPSGYRVEVAQGSEMARDIEAAGAKVAEQEAARGNAADVVSSAADRAKTADEDRMLRGIFGYLARANPSSNNAEVYRQVDVLKSIASAEALNAMRRQSPTGGALGNVSEKELKLLSEQAGALDPASPNFRRDLQDYETALMRTIHGPTYGTNFDIQNMSAPEIQDLMLQMPPDQMSPGLRSTIAERLRQLKGEQ